MIVRTKNDSLAQAAWLRCDELDRHPEIVWLDKPFLLLKSDNYLGLRLIRDDAPDTREGFGEEMFTVDFSSPDFYKEMNEAFK